MELINVKSLDCTQPHLQNEFSNVVSPEPKTSKSQNGHRVVKKVLNTYYYVYTYIQTYKVIKCREVTQNT